MVYSWETRNKRLVDDDSSQDLWGIYLSVYLMYTQAGLYIRAYRNVYMCVSRIPWHGMRIDLLGPGVEGKNLITNAAAAM